ncbi:MAG: hypothetical protein U5K38_14305 [Woeseiaceae bacterium]|nr:hypothetical protein [Woeseiaceae bacterium]
MENIELSDFVRNALLQIAKGVREANEELLDPEKHQYHVFNLRHNKGDSPKVPGIRCDVAVTASKGQKDRAGFFVALVNAGGGANTEKLLEGQTVQRIQFQVGIESTWL